MSYEGSQEMSQTEAQKVFSPEKKARLLEVQRLASHAEEEMRAKDYPHKIFYAVIEGDEVLTQLLREQFLIERAAIKKLRDEERPLFDEYTAL